MMRKILTIVLLLLLFGIVPLLSSCFGPPQQGATNQVAPAAPDFTAIDNALKDPSPIVRKQAVENLKQYNHIAVIDIAIRAIKENIDDTSLINSAVSVIIIYKDQAIEPVKKAFWDDPNVKLQLIGYNILSNIIKTEDFYKDVQTRFYELPQNEETATFREVLASYMGQNATKGNADQLTNLVAMLSDADASVVNTAVGILFTWKDPAAIESIMTLYYQSKNDPEISNAVLDVLSNYDAPAADNKATALTDMSIFLDTFGSYDSEMQLKSYTGLKKFGYNDADGKIVNYIKRFENCDNENVRSNVLELLQTLPAKQYPQGVTPPTFQIPPSVHKEGFCS